MPRNPIESSLIRATYRIVTPMFCGGAEQQAEFRLASFKGVLRFWWRALEWQRLQDLNTLRKEEAELFGSSDEGQSQFLMRLTQPPTGIVIDRKSQLKDGNELVGEGARYLGYGVMEAYGSAKSGKKPAELSRPCLAARDAFELAFRFVPGANELHRQQITRTLKLVGLLGGMGGKSRKGYGSLTLASLSSPQLADLSPPKTLDEFRKSIEGLWSEAGCPTSDSSLPRFQRTRLTAFASGFRIVAVTGREGDSALRLLDRIGREMVRYRSWGRNGKVLGNIGREGNFQPDHDLMKRDSRSRHTHPQRIAFGLPHNYGPDQVKPANSELDRRASPLLIHIHQAEGSPPLGVLTFLPGMFLPEQRDAISVGGKNVALQTKDFWKPVTDFLDRLLDKSDKTTRKEFNASDRIEEVASG